MDLGIEGNAALLTASSSGLGKASAKALARGGANVVVNGRDEGRIEEAVAEVESTATGEVVGQPGDITDPGDVAALVERTVDEFGGIDHLVTSAGGPTPMSPLEATDDDWYGAFDLLVMGVVRTVREAADHLRAGDGGTVVTITSRAVKEASPTNVLSSSVRMAVMGLEKSLSRELAPEVRVNAALPGTHDTPRVRKMWETAVESGEFDSIEAAREGRAADIPVGRVADPMEFGEVVAFLSSARSSYVNGVAVPVDGGSMRSTL